MDPIDLYYCQNIDCSCEKGFREEILCPSCGAKTERKKALEIARLLELKREIGKRRPALEDKTTIWLCGNCGQNYRNMHPKYCHRCNGTRFKILEEIAWFCKGCGVIFSASVLPKRCPACGSSRFKKRRFWPKRSRSDDPTSPYSWLNSTVIQSEKLPPFPRDRSPHYNPGSSRKRGKSSRGRTPVSATRNSPRHTS